MQDRLTIKEVKDLIKVDEDNFYIPRDIMDKYLENKHFRGWFMAALSELEKENPVKK